MTPTGNPLSEGERTMPEHDPADDDHSPFDDEDEADGWATGEECGRWINGRLTNSCTKAGSEECDWECPYRNTLRFAGRAALSPSHRDT